MKQDQSTECRVLGFRLLQCKWTVWFHCADTVMMLTVLSLPTCSFPPEF